MKSLILAVATISIASVAYATEPVARTDVEARLDALEKINVTAAKPAKADDEVKDAQLDAILQKAADAEATGQDAPR